ncbi:hypothetical protein, partial [Dialister sp. UBA1703]|uniref:hypothetical protein n=1 Tax=Dialister sp. UBA1703 TaxID=1946415 RepID=UPI0025BFEF6C
HMKFDSANESVSLRIPIGGRGSTPVHAVNDHPPVSSPPFPDSPLISKVDRQRIGMVKYKFRNKKFSIHHDMYTARRNYAFCKMAGLRQ